MAETFTFTARDANNPTQVITITLYPQYARINLTGLWDQLANVGNSEAKLEAAGSQLAVQAKPAALKVIEAISGPVHLSDLDVQLEGESFKLTAWQRVRGLRLAPVSITIKRVDNPDAAAGFLAELDARREAIESASFMPGPFDYWAGWAALAVGAVAAFVVSRRRN